LFSYQNPYLYEQLKVKSKLIKFSTVQVRLRCGTTAMVGADCEGGSEEGRMEKERGDNSEDRSFCTRVYPKVPGLSHNEIYAYSNKHSLRSNTKDYDGKTR
jgi:hypothetical protein